MKTLLWLLLLALWCLPAPAATEEIEISQYFPTSADVKNLKAAPGANDSVVFGSGLPDAKLTIYGTKNIGDLGAESTYALDIRDTSGNPLFAVSHDGTLHVSRIASLNVQNRIDIASDVKYVVPNAWATQGPPGPAPSNNLPAPSYNASQTMACNNGGAVVNNFWSGVIGGPQKVIVHVSFGLQYYDNWSGGVSKGKVEFTNWTTFNVIRTVHADATPMGRVPFVTAVKMDVPIYIPGSSQRTYYLQGTAPSSCKSGGAMVVEDLFVWFENVGNSVNTTGWPN